VSGGKKAKSTARTITLAEPKCLRCDGALEDVPHDRNCGDYRCTTCSQYYDWWEIEKCSRACTTCGGMGRLRRPVATWTAGRECSRCQSTGWVSAPCRDCGGRSSYPAEEKEKP
jgi:hypothetical protein